MSESLQPEESSTEESTTGEAVVKGLAYDPFSWPYLLLGAGLFLLVLAMPAVLAYGEGLVWLAALLGLFGLLLIARAIYEVSRRKPGVSRAFVFAGWALSTFVVVLADGCSALS